MGETSSPSGRPDPLQVREDGIPPVLKQQDQWICWRYEWTEDREEWTKIPVDPNTGGRASSTDSATWTSFSDAVKFHERTETDSDGLGFVFAEDDDLVGIDLDDCRDPETGHPEQWAVDIVNTLESFTEVSPSGTGFHVFAAGEIPAGGNRKDDVEMYDSGRYFTVTGHHVDITPLLVESRQDAIADVHAEYIADDEQERAGPEFTPAAEMDGAELSDEERLERARNADNGEKFRQLYDRGDASGYPSHSEARQALANMLAFWTRGDERRMLELFRRSALCRGDDDLRTFEHYEIPTALEGRTEFYDPEGQSGTTADGATSNGEPLTPADASLTPTDIVRVLGEDPDEASAEEFPNAKIAWAFDAIIDASDEHHFRVLDEDTEEIYAYDTGEGVWRRGGDRRLKQLARQVFREQGSRTLFREIVHQARSNGRRVIERDTLGIDEGLLACANGIIDLRDPDAGTREPTPEDYLLGKIPADYDPDASIEGTRFAAYLEESVAPEDREKLQEYAGYCLWTGGQPYKKALFLIGPTDSGKGTFLKTIETVIGEENVAWQPLYKLIRTRWGTANIYGKMVNMANEVAPGSLKGVERFKELTGGEDTVTAERKGQPTFEFVVTQKFLFATNRFPRMQDAGTPFFNRCLFAEFPESVDADAIDPDLLDAFAAERSAILNWMLEGLARLREQDGFSDERSVEAKRGLTKSFGSPVEQFVFDAIEVTGDPTDVVHKKELYQAFTRFCDFIDAEDTPSQTAFTRRIKEESGISDGKSRRVGDGDGRTDVYTGIRVDVEALRRIQADVPDHATSDGRDLTPAEEARQTSVVEE